VTFRRDAVPEVPRLMSAALTLRERTGEEIPFVLLQHVEHELRLPLISQKIVEQLLVVLDRAVVPIAGRRRRSRPRRPAGTRRAAPELAERSGGALAHRTAGRESPAPDDTPFRSSEAPTWKVDRRHALPASLAAVGTRVDLVSSTGRGDLAGVKLSCRRYTPPTSARC
jgi:hypothetical protein